MIYYFSNHTRVWCGGCLSNAS